MIRSKFNVALALCVLTLSNLFIGCDKDDFYPAPPVFFGFVSEDGTTSFNDHVWEIGCEQTDLTLSPFIMTENTHLTNAEWFSATKVISVKQLYGSYLLDHKGLPWDDVQLTQINENEWECQGLKITKSIKDNCVFFNFKFDKNASEKNHIYQINFEATTPKDSGLYADEIVSQLLIRQEGSILFKGRYKKQTYISKITEDRDGNISYEDEDTRNLINLLGDRNDIETVVFGDMVYFFDGEDVKKDTSLRRLCTSESEELPESAECVSLTRATVASAFSKRISGALGYAILFDDTDFEDSNIYSNLTENFYKLWEVMDLADEGLNDKVSSLAVYYGGLDRNVTCVLTVWEDANFNHGDDDRTKHRMSFISSINNRQMIWNNLKKIPCIGSSNSWNDRISSLSLHFGNYGINMADY